MRKRKAKEVQELDEFEVKMKVVMSEARVTPGKKVWSKWVETREDPNKQLLRHVHLRLTILRVDARSATAQENTSHVVTRPRMVAELVVAFTDPGSFRYSGAAASLLLDGGICSVIEHQEDQLMYQQMVIDEAGAARTPVPQHAQEYRGRLVDLRIGNEPETLAVDEKLCAELADVEANPLGDCPCLE